MKTGKRILISCFLFLLSFSKANAQCSLFYFFSNDYNCNTNQAIATFTISGALAPYTCTFVNIASQTVAIGTAVVNTGSVTGLAPGPHTVYISSANGCTASAQFNIVIPFSSGNIAFSASHVSCFGGSNGSATANVNPGGLTLPFTYSWSTGSTVQTTGGLLPGVYTLTVKDANNCTISNSVAITQPSPVTSFLSNTLVTCYGGTLSSLITSTGGTSPYTYSVNGVHLIGTTANGIAAGVNTITTKDFKNCITTNTVLVSQNPPANIGFGVVNPSCPSSTNGALTATASNGPAPFTYTWQPGNFFTPSVSNIGIGNYTLTVKDASSCITKSVVNVTPLVSMAFSLLTKPENCSAADGAFTINVSGGGTPYSFSTTSVGVHSGSVITGLSSGAYTMIVTESGNCKDTLKFVIGNLSTVSLSLVNSTPPKCYQQCTGSVTLSIVNAVQPVTYSASGTPTTNSNILTNLCSGFVTVKAIDNIGCPATLTLNFPSPAVFSYSAASPPPICIGKAATLNASSAGGTGTHNYVWNPGNISGASVTVSPVSTTVYSLNVYDSNGCTLAPFTVTVNVNPALAININSSNSGICPGTTAQISPTITGGDGNYSFNWLPGNNNASSLFLSSITVPEYTLTVNDGCGSPSAVKVITVNLFPVIVPVFSLSTNQGCEPLCIQFSNQTPKSANAVWNYGDRPYEQAGQITNYCYDNAGLYTVRLAVNDSNNCRAVGNYTGAVKVNHKPRVSFVTDPANVDLTNGVDVKLINATEYGNYFLWVRGNDTISITKHAYSTFTDTGCVKFTLYASNDFGCADTLEQNVCVSEGFNFWMPDTFTPNGDGLNDVYRPSGTGWSSEGFLFEIYNRWGVKVFTTGDINHGWDGKIKGEQALFQNFLWYVKLKDNSGNQKQFRGYVTVLK